MNPILKRFFGYSFIVFAIIGIIISVIGIYGVWQVHSTLQDKFNTTTKAINSTLSATIDGMTMVEITMESAMETIDSSERVLLAMAETMGDINNLTSGFQGLFRLRLPGLELGDNNFEDKTENFAVVETEIENIATNFSQFSSAMTEAQEVVGSYQNALTTTQEQFLDFRANGSKYITTLTWILTILLVWFAIAQIGFMIQGFEFIRLPIGRQIEEREPDVSE
jgi:hypothetical protein